MAGTVEQIFIVAEPGDAPRSVAEVLAHAGRGLEGDRNLSAPDRWIATGCALTLIEAEVIEAVLQEHGLDLREGRSRRQVVTRGVRLNELVGRIFRVGPLRCRGVELCEPCLDLQRMLGDPGTIRALVHRGGLRADILDGGQLSAGDLVSG
jgi:MOSC domain-containing protein YiiM